MVEVSCGVTVGRSLKPGKSPVRTVVKSISKGGKEHGKLRKKRKKKKKGKKRLERGGMLEIKTTGCCRWPGSVLASSVGRQAGLLTKLAEECRKAAMHYGSQGFRLRVCYHDSGLLSCVFQLVKTSATRAPDLVRFWKIIPAIHLLL